MMKLGHRIKNKKQDHGFTIVELMIATLVFSTVLVLLTTGAIYFTNMYYKSVNLSNTQDTARRIADNISRAIQFSGDTFKPPVATAGQYAFCIGNRRYTYWQTPQKIDPATGKYHALVTDIPAGTCTATPVGNFNMATVTGAANTTTELLSRNMRLTGLSVSQTGNVYTINVGIAYGDDDLLGGTGFGTYCKSGAGSQYCAVSALYTTVQQRVNP